MVEILKNMVKRAWGIIISGSATWNEIAVEKTSVSVIRRQYVFPWIALTVAVAFLFNLQTFEKAILNAIITAISLFGGYFISNFICFAYLKNSRPDLASKTDSETLIAYSYTIIILIDLVTIIAPSLFFLRVLSIFAAYVIWEGCRAIWQLKEDERGNIVLIFSLVVIFVSVIINRMIHWMLPNA